MSINPNAIATFGDVRRNILDVIADLRAGTMEVARGEAIFKGFSELNKSIQVEINATKMSFATEGKAHQFGKVVSMGRRLIANGPDQEAS